MSFAFKRFVLCGKNVGKEPDDDHMDAASENCHVTMGK